MATRSLVVLACLLVGMTLAAPVVAQTQLSLRTQGRDVDFGNAISTRPLKTGPTLPVTCNVGELFFRTGVVAGKNLFGCTSLNTWTVQAEVIAPAGMSNYVTSFSSQTSLTITAAMHGFTSPNLLVNCFDTASPASYLAPLGVTIDSATYEVNISFPGTRSGRCVINAPGTAYVSGEGLVQSGPEFSVDTVTVPSFLRTQLDFDSWTLAAQSCEDRPLVLEGAALLDAVAPAWPADLNSPVNGSMFVAEAGVLTVRLCNVSAEVANVPPRTFGAAILKSF